MAGSLGLIGWLRWSRIVPVLARCWPVIALALLVLASTLWSINTTASLRYGTLYLVTAMLGIALAGLVSARGLVIGLFLAFGLFNVVSLVFGGYVPLGANGSAFAGITPSKNMAAQVAGFGLLTSLAVIVLALSERRLLSALAAVGVILVCAWTLRIALSTGALVATLAGASAMLVFLFSRLLPPRGRVLIALSAIPVLVVMLVLANSWLVPMFDLILASSGKDSGLTGRSFLWQRADDLIAARPLFGLGYGAFWVPGNLAAEGLWDQFGIATRTGFHFHNTPREILVHLGWVGLIAYGVVAAIGLARLIARQVLFAGSADLLMIGLATFLGAALPFELVGFATMHFASVLTITVLAFGYLRFDTVPVRASAVAQARGRRGPVRGRWATS
ncbi:O-antigen ligase family protein [Qipengyuania qiaonensis]|uniref:O-antigen ligase family protein n=1 Tax=Qipengyuania qiaonensis TaxID=2867240 RepID=A0ABS7JBF9_9SPHN|nr:O-antigen ligase family protein [Qipengyuania qiaonensis]MBX7483661.1 O-antigen ligase family protein [Qipengyuania qiaonensis]